MSVDVSITLLWLIFWLMFIVFPKRSAAITAFAATLMFIFLNLGLSIVTTTGVYYTYLLLYAILLLDLGSKEE